MILKKILGKTLILLIFASSLSACTDNSSVNSLVKFNAQEDSSEKSSTNNDPATQQDPTATQQENNPTPAASSQAQEQADHRDIINAADGITENLPPEERNPQDPNPGNVQGQVNPSIEWVDPRLIQGANHLNDSNGATIHSSANIDNGIRNDNLHVADANIDLNPPHFDHTCQAQTGKIEVIMNPGNNRDLLIKEYDNFPYQNPDRSTVMRDGNNAQFKNTPVVIRCQGNIDLSQAPLRGVAPNAHAIFAYEIHASNVRDRIHGSNTRDLIYSGLGDDPVWTMGGSDRLVDMAEAGPMDQRYGQHTEEDEYIVIGE